jgi:regulator of sigma E protease
MSLIGQFVSLLGYIAPFVFVLTIIVFFHELGHFLVGRWCGVKVDVFSIGFGPELLHFVDRKGTRWRIAALPLGGYVKFHGDANGASMADETGIAAMPVAEQAVTFAAQKVWARAAIVGAGPIANFLLAIAIFSATFYFIGRGVLLPRIEAVIAGGAAEAAGFKAGDLVLSVDGHAIDSFDQMRQFIATSSDMPLSFVVARDQTQLTLVATPQRQEMPTAAGKQKMGVLGIKGSSDPADWRIEHYGAFESVKLGVSETGSFVRQTLTGIGGLFSGRESTDQISGPIRIAEVSGNMAKLGIGPLFSLAAILSISVGLINLFPVPLLDGGHLMYYAVEAVRGRPLSPRAQELGFRVGLALVAMLMIFATFNDILHLNRG